MSEATSGVEVPHLASAHAATGPITAGTHYATRARDAAPSPPRGKLRAGSTLLCMGLFSRFLFRPSRAPPRGAYAEAGTPCLSLSANVWRGVGARCHAVFAAFNPSRVSTASRITNFWILPVTVIGNSSTNST